MRTDVERNTSSPPADSNHSTSALQMTPARASWRIERRLLNWVLKRIGSPQLTVELWDGTLLGNVSSAIGRIVIHSPSALRRILIHPSLAFGECYTTGQVTVQGNLIAVITEINRASTLAGFRMGQTSGRYWRHKNSLRESKSNVVHHYDLGNEFYRLWLDEMLVYTCAYYPNPEANLSEAQIAKLDYVCRKLRLRPGERVIEAGCGWGALAMHMVRHYGVSVEAYNLSREQVAFARERAQACGLSDRLEFIEEDYRRMRGTFDVFVSVGMLEHVGLEASVELGALISRVLTTDGRGLIHSIGRNVSRPLDDWTEKYIFPGARPPSLREMMDLFEGPGFSVLDVENLRPHYARTCADWLARFEQVSEQVRQMFDDNFVRMWRLYLAASSSAFENGDLQLFQVVFARSNNNGIPCTRDDWYRAPLASSTRYHSGDGCHGKL